MSHSSTSKLLNADGDVTEELERCLKHIFANYCTPQQENDADGYLTPSPDAYLSPEGLDKWAVDTNGEVFSDETKEEIIEFFDTTGEGNLTLKGFLQLYVLQTSNDEQETWKDLEKHGFDGNLRK